jgi:hypothetical protein
MSITVEIDNRVRLLSALLSLTTWPEQEQGFKPHGIHAHAKSTRQYLAEAEYHPAVIGMQEALESGESLSDVFRYSCALNWPGLRLRGRDGPQWASPDWPAHIRDFAHSMRIDELWHRDRTAWTSAVEEAQRALEPGDPVTFLSRFFGPLDVQLIFVPNLCYPTSETLGFRDGKRLVAICPPPIAWGTNPPWPYDDNPGDTPRDAIGTYTRVLLRELLAANPEETDVARKTKLPVPNTFRARYPDWIDQFQHLFVSGVTVLYLQATFGSVESDAYLLMTNKTHGSEVVSSVAEILGKYLESQAQGKYVTFIEYLPAFLKSLRIAEKLKWI